MKKAVFIYTEGGAARHECDDWELVGQCVRLYETIKHGEDKVARPDERKLVGAFWGIYGFMVDDEE